MVMAEKRVHLDALRDGASKEKDSHSDHELDSDFVVGPEWKGYDAAKHEVKVESIRKIKVTKLPEGITEEILMHYFENRRRNGGGPIESIEYHPATSSAIIEFQETDVVDRVLKKRPLFFLKKQISVEEYVEEMEEEEEELPCHTIEVRGFAENTVEEVLEMYFENTNRSGGGNITSAQIEDGVAHLTFEDEDVASSVCEREHILGGRKLSVSLHLPKKKSSVVEAKTEEEEEPVCTVEVRGYNVGSEVTIELYFENAKRSGGDEIVKFDPVDSEGIIFITFAREEVARRVAGRQHVLADCILDVKLYEPPKRKSARNLSHISSKKPEESIPHCTVEVRGVAKSLNLTTLQLYFENKKRSGGDEILKFKYKEENEIAYITYESEEVAQRVVIHGKHKVEGQPLKVILYIPPQHKPTYGDRVLLAGLSSNITRDALINFMEARINLTPTDFLYDEEGDKVMIRFDENIDFQKLEHACKKRVIDNNYLQPSKVPVSNCILVLKLKITTTEDMIELYFENEKRSRGGPVEKVVFNREEEYCLVYFEDHTICDRVLQRKHKIDGSELQVSIYYESLGRISEDDNGPSFKPPKPLKLENDEETNSFENEKHGKVIIWTYPNKKQIVLLRDATCDAECFITPEIDHGVSKSILDDTNIEKRMSVPLWKGEGKEKHKLLEEIEKVLRSLHNKSRKSASFCIQQIEHWNFKHYFRCFLYEIDKFYNDLPFVCSIEYLFLVISDENLYQVASDIADVFLQNKARRTPSKDYIEHSGTIDEDVKDPVFRIIKVSIHKGHLHEAQTDVLVNTISTNLDLTIGTISASLLRKAGNGLQKEISLRCGSAQYGMVIKTGACQLPCRAVYHGALKPYHAQDDSVLSFQKFLHDCLQQASKSKYKSIAFPAIGTGRLGYPRDMVANLMIRAVMELEKSMPMTSLKEVKFVIHPICTEAYQAFQDQLQHLQSSHKEGSEGLGAGKTVNVFEELFRVVNESQWSFVILTKEFSSNCCEQAVFKKLIDKTQGDKLIPIMVQLPDELEVNSVLSFEDDQTTWDQGHKRELKRLQREENSFWGRREVRK